MSDNVSRRRSRKTFTIPDSICMTLDEAIDDKRSSLYVINNVPMVHQMNGTIILAIMRKGTERTTAVAVKDTWMPQDLTQAARKDDILEDPIFRSYVGSGALKIIRADAAMKILASPAARDEMAFINRDRAKEAAEDAIDGFDGVAHANKSVVNVTGASDITIAGNSDGQMSADPVLPGLAGATRLSLSEEVLQRLTRKEIGADAAAATLVALGNSGELSAKEAMQLQERELPGKVHQALQTVLTAKTAVAAKAQRGPLPMPKKAASSK